MYTTLSVSDIFLRFIDFASVTSEELDLLLATCEPIPFRRESEGGSDESYRNASKLEAPDFAVQLDPVGSGLMRNVEDKLLQREMEDKCLRAEVCELNAYGEHPPEVSSIATLSNVVTPA